MARTIGRLTVAGLACSIALVIAACTNTTNVDATPSGTDTTAHASAPTSRDGNGVTLGLTYIPNVQFSPVYVAEDEGIYRAAGLNMTVRHHGGDEGLFTALTAGEEDMVLASGDELYQAREQGMDLVSVGTYYQRYPVTIVVPEESPISTVKDLKGKKIGVPGEYGSSWFGLLAILRNASMNIDDINVVSIGYTQQAALAGKQVDAIVAFTNNEPVRFSATGMKVRTLPVDGDLPLVSASLVTRREWFDEHQEIACQVVEGTAAGIRRAVEQPQLAIEATQRRDTGLTEAAQVEGARAVLKATTTLFAREDGTYGGPQDLALWEQMADFYQTIPGLLAQEPDVKAAVTNACYE